VATHPDFSDTELANNVSLFPLGLIRGDRRPGVVADTPVQRRPDVDVKARVHRGYPSPISFEAAEYERAESARRAEARAVERACELRAAHERGYQRGAAQTQRRYRGERAYWLALGITLGLVLGLGLIRLGMWSV